MTKTETIDKFKDNFDILIFTDGSGTTLRKTSAYCAFLIDLTDKLDSSEKEWQISGSCSNGTNNYAEMNAALSALWVVNGLCKQKIKIGIITDSELMVRTHQRIYERKNNLGLWASMDYYSNIYDITLIHVNRNTNYYNALCDEVAGSLRKGAEREIETRKNLS